MEQLATATWDSLAIFLVEATCYDRMYNALKEGAPFVYSYIGTCPHGDPNTCICPKRKNILVNDKIVRICHGQQKPVLRGPRMF